MGKIQAKSIFRLVPIIGDLGRFLLAFTLNNTYSTVNVDDVLQISSVLPLAKNFKNESFLVVHGTGDGEFKQIFCS